MVELCSSNLCFELVFLVKLGYSCLCFEWGLMIELGFDGLCFSGLYHAFQAETWVDLRWCTYNDLCELHIVCMK
jgi:hypothetical protein